MDRISRRPEFIMVRKVRIAAVKLFAEARELKAYSRLQHFNAELQALFRVFELLPFGSVFLG
jgi:hypothetical protein